MARKSIYDLIHQAYEERYGDEDKSDTGKSLSETLIFASTNPQYDDRLFIVHKNCKLRIPAEHVVYTNWFFFVFILTFRTTYVHNMLYPCSPYVLSMF